MNEVERLIAENERLREALREIAGADCEDAGRSYCYDFGPPNEVEYCASCRARAALKHPQDER